MYFYTFVCGTPNAVRYVIPVSCGTLFQKKTVAVSRFVSCLNMALARLVLNMALARLVLKYTLVQYKWTSFHLRFWHNLKMADLRTTTYLQQTLFRSKKIASEIFNMHKAGLDSQHCEGRKATACFSNFKRGVNCVEIVRYSEGI